MWIILGFLTAVMTFMNLYRFNKRKDYKLYMALALTLTALENTAHYNLVSNWVLLEDWTALLDVVPSMEIALWAFTIISITLNLSPVLLASRTQR